MKSSLVLALAAILLTLPCVVCQAEEGPDHWTSSYYQKPSPERLVEELRSLTDQKLLESEEASGALIGFLSQVMAANPERIGEWLEAFSDLDEQQRKVLLAAAWYSDTKAARDCFRKHKLDAYLERKSPAILKMEVEDGFTLDMLWGYFMATGDEEPVHRIVSALSLSRYSGAVERLKESAKTKRNIDDAMLDATFQAAMWSLESNCRQHPLVLEHCRAIFEDPDLPKDQSFYLATVLSRVEPENYRIGIPRKSVDSGEKTDEAGKREREEEKDE